MPHSVIVLLLIFVFPTFSITQDLISDGSFEYAHNSWFYRGDCLRSPNLPHSEYYSVEISKEHNPESYAYQYFRNPEKNFEATIWVNPAEKAYYSKVEIVANWDKRGFDNFITLSFDTDSLFISTLGSDLCSFSTPVKPQRWNKISILSDSAGLRKKVSINDTLICLLLGENVISATAIILGGINCKNCSGKTYFDDVSVITRSYKSRSITYTSNEVELFLFKAGLGKSFAGPTWGAGICYGRANDLFALRYLQANEFRFNIDGAYDDPAKKLKELGILYGKYYRDKNIIISLAGGISLVTGIDRGNQIRGDEYKKIKISTMGIPIEGTFMLSFSKHFGMSLSFFANINSQRSFAGMMLGIQLGEYSD